MRLTLIIDATPHQIDSTDPELLARWIVEIFGRIRYITPATRIEFQACPSFLPDENGREWRPDWAVNSRVMPARSPRELLAELGKQLDALGVT